MGSFLSSVITLLPLLHFLFSCMRLSFSPGSILDKAIVLDKTCLVTQRAIMESNYLIDTELALRATPGGGGYSEKF